MYMNDVLFGIIAFYPDTRFPIIPRVLHPALSEMKKRYPDVFKNFEFEDSMGFPYSDKVEVYINVFRCAGILDSSLSETPEILEGLRKDVRGWDLPQEQLNKLEQIAKEFYHKVNFNGVA